MDGRWKYSKCKNNNLGPSHVFLLCGLKVLFVLKEWSSKKQETLASYYVRTKEHLIPKDVEVWEFDELDNNAKRIK